MKLIDKKTETDLLKLCKKHSGEIIIIPAGLQAIKLSEYLKSHNIDICFFVDNSPKKQGKIFNDIEVLSFEKLQEVYSDKLILVATNEWFEKSISEQLISNKITFFTPVMEDFLLFSKKEIDFAKDLINQKIEKYQLVYNMLEDDLSKKTFINKLNFLISYDTKYTKKIKRAPQYQYFEPEIYKVSTNDYFVDCGAYDGDTLNQLLKNTGNEIMQYYGFEPDDKNYEKLIQNTHNKKNMTIFKKGISNINSTLKFNSLNNAISQIDENGNVEIDVVSLDEILADKKVTFIKMDIEGSEKEALIGAQNIIKTQKPTLAISVYHDFYDIYKIPLLIKSFGVNYKYYLRHYTLKAAETILYAVPD